MHIVFMKDAQNVSLDILNLMAQTVFSVHLVYFIVIQFIIQLGKYSNADAKNISECRENIKPRPRHRIRQYLFSDCPLGTVTHDSGCSRCNQGGYASIGAIECVLCDSGKYSLYDNSSFCSTCETGYYASKVRHGCNQCAKGINTKLIFIIFIVRFL